MVLALPVYHPRQPGHMLLKPGAALDSDAIARLRELRIGVLWISYPALDYIVRYVSPRILAQHARLTATIAEGFDGLARQSHASVDFRPYSLAVNDLLGEFIQAPQASLFLNQMVDHGRPMMAHASNVCFLSLLMGLKLEGYLMAQRKLVPPHRARKIASLGVGAMLHDLGMLRLPDGVVHRWERTHDESDPEFRKHCKLGFEMVRTKVPPTAAGAVLHHHQRMDGSGFPALRRSVGPPAPPSGSEIHIFGRIVAVADLYDRYRLGPTTEQSYAGEEEGSGSVPTDPQSRVSATSGTVFPKPSVRVLRMLLEDARRGTIDPVVFRALLSVAPAYAPGTTVTLSDGRRCAVVAWSPADPCRPTVCPLDPSRPDAPGEAIDLSHSSQQAGLTITHAEGQDVRADNFYPAPQDVGAAAPGAMQIREVARWIDESRAA
jgi:HD-GYP domain-containing protein (c-di-GMP phosphodiesterase class II)